MKINLRIIALALFTLTFAACKKDIKDTQKKMILLTDPKGWLTVKIEVKAGNEWLDITGNPIITIADNLLIFDPFYNWAQDEGPTKLPGDPQIISSGTWSWLDNKTKIQIEDGNLIEILELSKTAFIMQTTVNGITKKYTYKHP